MKPKILIIGSGPCAGQIADNLFVSGFEIIHTSPNGNVNLSGDLKKRAAKALELMTDTHLSACRGAIGKFDISLDNQGQIVSRRVAHIVIADEYQKKPNFSLYRLRPSPAVISRSQFSGQLSGHHRHENAISKIVFLTGIKREENPVVTAEIMRDCLLIQTEFKHQTYLLTRNLKVAGNGLEELYRKTKKAGTIYVKFNKTTPIIQQGNDGRVQIEFTDESMRQRFKITPDVTVVDETICPSDHLAALSEILKLEMDPDGFIQADNVHRHGIYTNRKGIWVAGPSRGIQSQDEQMIDAGNAVIAALRSRQEISLERPAVAEIDADKCVRCLTCFRICPHRAVLLNTRPRIEPGACEGCGICAAECPMNAITLKELKAPGVSPKATPPRPVGPKNNFSPHLAVLCCRRSAGEAARAALGKGPALPCNLSILEYPCAGAVSFEHIYTVFKQQADGVLVITCHADNCHSSIGNERALSRVDQIRLFFQKTGLEPERLQINTLAANMAAEFTRRVNDFEKQIRALGPSRLKSGMNNPQSRRDLFERFRTP